MARRSATRAAGRRLRARLRDDGARLRAACSRRGARRLGRRVRPCARGTPSDEVKRMLEAYVEYYEIARTALRPGATAHDVHRAVSAGFTQRGYHLGHVTGHSIGMTMIEHPKIGVGIETELAANMVFSMHPHAIAADGRECVYMQDTWLVTEDGGVSLAGLEMRIW